jgi:hypothetical protein
VSRALLPPPSILLGTINQFQQVKGNPKPEKDLLTRNQEIDVSLKKGAEVKLETLEVENSIVSQATNVLKSFLNRRLKFISLLRNCHFENSSRSCEVPAELMSCLTLLKLF